MLMLTPLPGAFAGVAPDAPAPDPCALLLDDEIRSMQGREVVERIRSSQRGPRLRVLRCFYRTDAHSGSVSLALSLPLTEAVDGARRYWEERFHPRAGFPDGKRQPPLPLEGLGEEAFWVGDPVAGSIYVLTGDGFLRISVGGAPDEATRRARSVALARDAVARMERLDEAPL